MQFPLSTAVTDKATQRDRFPIPNHHHYEPSRIPQRVRSHFYLTLWLFLGVLLPVSAFGGEVTLEWIPFSLADHYTIFWGTNSGRYTQKSAEIPQPKILDKNINHTITGLTIGKTYYFIIKTFNEWDTPSNFSNEVSTRIGYYNNASTPIANAGLSQTVSVDTNDVSILVTLDGSKSNSIDAPPLTYSWNQTNGPAVSLSNTHAVSPTFLVPNVENSDAILTFILTLTDSRGETASDTTSVILTLANHRPLCEAGEERTLAETTYGIPTRVNLNGSGSIDPDDEPLSYSWIQTGGPSVTLDDAHTVSPNFYAPDVGISGAILTFSLTVTDSHGEIASDTTTITITFVENRPTADAGQDQDVYQGDMVSLSGEASWTPGDGIATWTWVQTKGPKVELTTPDKAIAQFTAPTSFLNRIDLLFTLTVTDKNGLSHSDTCTVQNNISPIDKEPVPLTIFDSTMDREEWLCMGWDLYGKIRDEAHVCAGDLTGDGKSEWVISLGSKETSPLTPGGIFQIVSSDARHLGWGKVPWEAYNNTNGKTWPACGDLNDDGRDEIIIGLGKGGERKIAIFSYDDKTATFRQWATVPEKEGDESMEAIHPACGNIDSDPCMELIVKLGLDMDDDTTTEENYAILDRPCTDNLTDPFTLTAWGKTAWREPCDSASSVLTIDWSEFTTILEYIRSQYNEIFQDKTDHIFLGYWSHSSQLFTFEEDGL